MSKISLQTFTDIVCAKNRIGFGDVCRLGRVILPDGVTSREEAEILIRLDRDVSRQDPAWATWLVGALVDYVVWGERPTGIVDSGKAAWITAALDGGGKATRTARLLAREIAREAHSSTETLIAFALGAPAGEPEALPEPATALPATQEAAHAAA